MNDIEMRSEQLNKMKTSPGFVAALDQSGGSTPKALAAYGVKEDSWTDEEGMYALVHQMRTRIITSPSFTGQRILGAILFENTMDREIQGRPTADYLWQVKEVVPFLKVDNGLAAEENGVQLMKPMPQLPELLAKANAKTHLRHQDALAHQTGQRNRHPGDRETSSLRFAAQINAARLGAGHRARSRHPQPRKSGG